MDDGQVKMSESSFLAGIFECQSSVYDYFDITKRAILPRGLNQHIFFGFFSLSTKQASSSKLQ